MKNIVRAFALSLVVTGAVASAHIAGNAQTATLAPRASAMPTPCCPPDDPNACGITQVAR